MRRVLVVATIALGAVVVVLVLAGGGDPYADLRVRAPQPIPGALGYALEPPPEGSRPVMPPAEAKRRYPADGGEVQVGFASVRDTLADRSIGPAWVLIARGVCLRNSKGELVSDARGTDPNDLDCTDATMWILAVDAETGEPLVALTGYDPGGAFRLNVART